MKKIAIFASGKGSNADNIIRKFKSENQIEVSLMVTNNPKSGVIDVAKYHKLPHLVISKEFFIDNELEDIDLIVLAGFLLKVPEKIWSKVPTINIHPSLLPKFGGKGMYGDNVFRAVIESKEYRTGITIHWVNGEYDKGNIILQKDIYLYQEDTIETLKKRTQYLEHKHYPEIIKELLLQN